MRTPKISVLFLILFVAAFLLYGFIIYPTFWYPLTRHKSIALLKEARSKDELTNAVGRLGLFITLTNNAWIAIRYTDNHGGSIRSCAVARDSSGSWFESNRHFCGTFQYWPRQKEEIAADEELPIPSGARSRALSYNGIFPTYKEMLAIESAPDLQTARRALVAIGFKEMNKE